MNVHLDISQLVSDPRRSGIQRAERELIRHWPGPARLLPCTFDGPNQTMRELPESVFAVLCDEAPPGGVPAELLRLKQSARPGPAVIPERLLNAELFLDQERAAYYRNPPENVRAFWLVYDFLPWLEPGWFASGSAARLMPYLRALRAIPDVAFISARTRDDHAQRIRRRPVTGPVIPMGGDGLRLERQNFAATRRDFVMLGTIEPRKNAAPVMLAFKSLWREGIDASLTMIGATSPDAITELALLSELETETRFRHLQHLSDAGVREALRGARAMVFPSEGEGFGIPPMEALHAGIPVIVSADLPALAAQTGLGQVRLQNVNANTINAAVRRLLDDRHARELWDEAAGLLVPSWTSYAEQIASWVQA